MERADYLDEHLEELQGEPRPSVRQVAWLFRHIDDHLRRGGSFRYLIYHRLGFGPESYTPLYLAGGMSISNNEYEVERKQTSGEKLWRSE